MSVTVRDKLLGRCPHLSPPGQVPPFSCPLTDVGWIGSGLLPVSKKLPASFYIIN